MHSSTSLHLSNILCLHFSLACLFDILFMYFWPEDSHQRCSIFLQVSTFAVLPVMTLASNFFFSWHHYFAVNSKYFWHLRDFCLCMRTFQILFQSLINMMDWKQCLWGLKSNKKRCPCRKSIFWKALIFCKPFELMAKRKVNTVWLHLSCAVLFRQASS